MKTKAFFFTSLLAIGLIESRPALSQTETLPQSDKVLHSVGISAGIINVHLRDNYLSSTTFKGSFFSSAVCYHIKSGASLHYLDIHFSTGKINSPDQPRDARQYIGSISYSYFHSINKCKGGKYPIEFFLGTGITSNLANTTFNSVDNTNGYGFYDQSWYWSHSLDLHIRGEFHLTDRNSLNAQFSIPALGLVSRPENGHYFNEHNARIINSFLNAAINGKPTFIWNNPVYSFRFEYLRSLGLKSNFRISYSFGYISSDTPQSMRLYSNNFLAGIIWQL
jgi:hypothetical protein